MKCACTKDVVMDDSGKIEFTKGRIYHSHLEEDDCLIDDSGDPHYVKGPSVDEAGFFEAHFVELVEEKVTPTNIDYAAALRAIDEFANTTDGPSTLFALRGWCKQRLNPPKAAGEL